MCVSKGPKAPTNPAGYALEDADKYFTSRTVEEDGTERPIRRNGIGSRSSPESETEKPFVRM